MIGFYRPSSIEVKSVLKLETEKRVKYFKNVVGECCYLWLCFDDNDNLLAGFDTENNEYVAVWPAKDFAEFVLTRTDLKSLNGKDYIKPMEIHKFLNEYLDELKENNIKILVFPTEDGGALFDADNFRNMMEEELLKYEDLEED